MRNQRYGLRVSYAVLACACALLSSLMTQGCSRRAKKPHTPPVSPEQIRVLETTRQAQGTRATKDLIDELFPGAQRVGGADVVNELADCVRERKLLLVPDVRDVPIDLWDPLEQYLQSGGAAVLIGRDPFASRTRRPHGEPQSEDELHTALLSRARHVEGFSSIKLWQHQNESGVMRGVVRMAKDAALPWSGVLVEADGFRDWDAMVQSGISPGTVLPDDNTLVFYARAMSDLTHLAVTCVEEDGSYWTHLAPVSDVWEPHVLHAWRFHYFHGGEQRGRRDDRLKLSRVKQIMIGPSMHLAQQAPGDHVYELSDVRLAQDPRTEREVTYSPDIPLLSPAYRYYATPAAAVRSLDGGRSTSLGATVQSPLPRARGAGGEEAPRYRWIPLYESLDEEGEVRGWPASIYVEHVPERDARKWAWIGVDAESSDGVVLKRMISDAVEKLRYGRFLFKAGSSTYALQQGEAITVSARWTAGASDDPTLRLRAELLRKDGTVLRRVLSDGVDERRSHRDRPVQVSLGLVPRVEYEPRDYVLRMTLEDASGSGEEYDVLEQSIKIHPSATTAFDEDRLAATGFRFTYRRRPIFLVGMNYWPLTVNGRHPSEEQTTWLQAGSFDPALIARDLDMLADVGVNALAIQYLHENEAPQLEYFIDEAKSRDMWVYLYVDHLNPLHADYEKAERLLSAARLSQHAHVFAIDVAWEPHLGHYEERTRLDSDWRAWLAEQYGSVEHAEAVLGVPLWRNEEGVTGPPDVLLTSDGEHRAAIAAYRRFVSDYISRRYGYARRFLRWHDCQQLVSARTGFGGTGRRWPDPQFPMDPASGAVHMDFISPEAWGLYGDHDAFMEVGFITAYCRGNSGGKPVLWLEYGANVGRAPQVADYANQVRVYDEMFDMAFRSFSAGTFAWWFPGGYRVDEGSDYGVIHPDGTWRDVDEAFRRAGQRLRQEKGVPQPWQGREVDVHADARGLSALWDRWRATYREEMQRDSFEELRAVDFGKLTTEIEAVGVGDVAHADPSPFRSLNAEWATMEVDGEKRLRKPGETLVVREQQHVKLELLNTGAATWVASRQQKKGTVWVRFEHPDRKPHHAKVGTVAFGSRAVVNWRASDAGTWLIRPIVEGHGAFGEPLRIEVETL